MYAYTPDIGRGFFEGVCTPSNATAHSCDPPPPRNTKEPEPRYWDSGQKWIISCPTVRGIQLRVEVNHHSPTA